MNKENFDKARVILSKIAGLRAEQKYINDTFLNKDYCGWPSLSKELVNNFVQQANTELDKLIFKLEQEFENL